MLPPHAFTPSHDLPAARHPDGHVRLSFRGTATDDDHAINDLSAAAFVGDALFLAGDEGACIERLVPTGPGEWGAHRSFDAAALLGLDPDDEIDIEGLAADDGWLWLTGSHARTRPKPKAEGNGPACIDIAVFANLKDTRARCVLARLPLTRDAAGHATPVARDGKRRAGLVRQSKKHGSKLAKLFRDHPVTGPTTRLAAKEGGLDIEGLAVTGGRIALGLRGPVVATYAMIAEPVLEAGKKGRLHVDPALALRLLDLEGLGVRDLLVGGEDLFILAGPTQDSDGRCAIFRWPGWRRDPARSTDEVRLHRPERLFDLPVRYRVDHPEGIEWLPGDGRGQRRLLVVYDSPSPARVDDAGCRVLGDVFIIARLERPAPRRTPGRKMAQPAT